MVFICSFFLLWYSGKPVVYTVCTLSNWLFIVVILCCNWGLIEGHSHDVMVPEFLYTSLVTEARETRSLWYILPVLYSYRRYFRLMISLTGIFG